jgi:hypothetical protein
MAITLRSQATDDLLLLNDLAKELLGRLGKDATQPGILTPEDMPAAMQTLKALPDGLPQEEGDAEADEKGHGSNAQPAFADEIVPLRRRAVPLVRMIEFALAENKPIVWGV